MRSTDELHMYLLAIHHATLADDHSRIAMQLRSCKPAWASPLLWLSCSVFAILGTGCAPAPVVSRAQREKTWDTFEAEVEAQSDNALRTRLDTVLQRGLTMRQLSAIDNAAWQIMHGVVCYGELLQIETPDRGLVGAVDYALSNGLIHGMELMRGDELPSTGRRGVKARLEPGSYTGQGHVDQWIAIFAMADLPLDRKVAIGGEQFKLEDWVRQAQYDTSNNPLNEFSWTLIALTHYLPDEPTWIAAGGTEVSWEDLVAVELEQGLSNVACGGTHRMAGIVRALAAKDRLKLPDSLVWSEARQLVQACVDSTRQNRTADGMLSMYYFERAGGTVDATAQLSSAGHLLEFLALALPREDLSSGWLELAAHRMCNLMETTEEADMDCGALYHGLNGLKIYRQRRFGSN